MRRIRHVPGLALLVVACLYLLPVPRDADETVPDSTEVSELLTEVKTRAVRVSKDADEMRKCSASKLSWDSQAVRINGFREHDGSLNKAVQQLSEKRPSASSWQRVAIDRIAPLATELASNNEKTIEKVDRNKSRLHTNEYKRYLRSNSEVASNLASLISDYILYGKSTAKFQRLDSAARSHGH